MDNGAIFCHVSRIMPEVSGIPCVTSGTQKWNGDSPNFMAKDSVISVDAVVFVILMTVHCPEYNRLMMMASMRIIDAVAWVMKYFVDASIDRGL